MRHPQFLLLLPIAFAACAQGGTETRPQSDVKIAASHHLFGFRALRGFGTFPVNPNTVFPDNAVLNFTDQSTYTLTRSSGTSPEDAYALANSGVLTLRVTGSGNEPTVTFPGGYGLVAAGNEDLFFIDRWSTPASPSIGLFVGTRIINGTAELAGGWHLLSLHTIFSASTVLTPNNVGRGAHGGISIDAGTPGSVRNISGTGVESTRVGLVFGGTVQALVQGGSGDGSLNLTISYQDDQQPANTADARVLRAAAGKDIVFAVDDDRTDGEAGLVCLVRKFDAPTTTADITRVAGTYLLGAETLFVNPTNAGTDAAVGTLELTSQLGFRIEMIGSQGIDFSYSGTFALSPDGGMVFTVSGTNETWFGAMHRDYNTVVLVDDFVETRANNTPELNLFVGVRKKATP